MGIIVSTAPGASDTPIGQGANDNVRGAPRPAPAPAAGSAALRLVLAFEDAWERARQRRELAGLSEWELIDAGWSRSDRQNELSKPFWR
jgi:uncharacterized protein YjiS (DUF1127 family)